jgi:hypothetical protein
MVAFHQSLVQECNMPFTTLTDEEEKELWRLSEPARPVASSDFQRRNS